MSGSTYQPSTSAYNTTGPSSIYRRGSEFPNSTTIRDTSPYRSEVPNSGSNGTTYQQIRSISPFTADRPAVTTVYETQPYSTVSRSTNPGYSAPSSSIPVSSSTARRDLEFFDNYQSSFDDFTPDIRKIIGMYMDTSLDVADVLVHGHESMCRPENLINFANDRNHVQKAHNDLKAEAAAHRQRVAKIFEDLKPKIPIRNDTNGMHLRNALQSIQTPGERPEKTSAQLKEVKDDLVIILDPEMTGQPLRKYDEAQLAKVKKDQLSKKNVVMMNSTHAPSNSTIKIKLQPDDRYIGHEVTKGHPADDVRVVIDKQQPIVYRQASPSPTIVTVTRPSEPVIVRKSKTPTKNRITTSQASIEDYRSLQKSAEPLIVEQEVQRSFVPVRSAA
jgi:hypothetical protein